MKKIIISTFAILCSCSTTLPEQQQDQTLSKALLADYYINDHLSWINTNKTLLKDYPLTKPSPGSTAKDFLGKGYQYLEAKQPAKANAVFDDVIQVCNEDEKYTNSSINSTVPEAQAILDAILALPGVELLTLRSYCHSAILLRGVASLDQGKIDTATQYTEKAIELLPKDPVFELNMGRIYLHSNKPQLALEFFQNAEVNISRESGQMTRDEEIDLLWQAKRGIGFSYLKLNKVKKAKKAFKASLKLKPENLQASKILSALNQ